jgi:hypothetical protein
MKKANQSSGDGMVNKLYLLLAFCFICSSCTTTLSVSRVNETNPETRVGIPYPLLFTRHEIELTRQVASCGSKLSAIVKADIKNTFNAPDPNQLFVIDPNSLSNPFKTSEVKLEYQANGAPTSLNATAEDHSVQIITYALETAVKLATIAASAAAPPEGGLSPEACSKAVIDALQSVKKQAPIVEAATKVVDTRTKDLKLLNTKATALGANIDSQTKADLSKAYDALVSATNDLMAKNSVLNKALSGITHKQTIYWPDNGDQENGMYLLPENIFKQWLVSGSDPKERRQFDVFITLRKEGSRGRTLGESDTVKPELGIPYRQPVVGRLTICTGKACEDGDMPIAQKVSDILQLGYVYYFPCKSRVFSSINCSYAMTDAGQLKTMGTAEKIAIAEAAGSAAKEIVTQAAAIQEVLNSSKMKHLEAATAALKARADYEAAANALQQDPQKSDKDQTATLKASTDLLNAQRAQLEAEDALAKALIKSEKNDP